VMRGPEDVKSIKKARKIRIGLVRMINEKATIRSIKPFKFHRNGYNICGRFGFEGTRIKRDFFDFLHASAHR
jgi:hypothetical protein